MKRTRWVLAAMAATIALIAIGPAVAASGAADPPIPGIFPTTTTTAKPKPRPTTTTTAYENRVPDQGFGTGDQNPAIRTAELMLNGQHYDVGKIDDTYDQDTAYAVTAFQKIQGMERTGRLTRDVAARLRQQKSPPPPVMGADAGARRAEIDLPRQVLLLIVDNAVLKVLPISTGSGRHYCENGHCGTAITPVGSYRVAYSVKGWQHSPLGYLYNPVYFDAHRGLAIHGSKSVPAQPVSHGCVRIPMTAAEWFPGQAPKGMPVYVLDGRTYVQPLS